MTPAAPASAQAANLPQPVAFATLVSYPAFYQGRQVIVRGEAQEAGSRLQLHGPDPGGTLIQLLAGRSGGNGASGHVEVRGTFWDVGQLKADDPRAARLGLDTLGINAGTWPKPGEILVLELSQVVPAEKPAMTTVRSIVLEPDRYDGQVVTLTAQYRARNLLGDLPRAPGVSRFDFVIRSAGAAVWVTGKQPRGRDFDFDLDSKIDTTQWITVTGTVRRGRGLAWIEASKLELGKEQTQPTDTDAAAVPSPPPPPAPPSELLFSMPTDGETDVSPAVVMRLQFSRDLQVDTIASHVRATYPNAPAGQPAIAISGRYDETARVLEIRFKEPLQRFQRVRVESLEGMTGTDGQPIKPWAVTFTVG